jgi:hypothetical protein
MKKVPHFLNYLQKRLFTHFSVFTMIVALSLTVFYSCKQENDILNVTSNNDIQKEARSFYDNALNELRSKNIDARKMTAQFNALDFTPDWENAIQHKKKSTTFIEVPVRFANNNNLALSGGSVGDKFDARTSIVMPVRLIIKKSGDGTFEANFMLLESSKPYADGIVPDFNLSKKINNFTGREYLFNLDGSFNKGWKHERGQIVDKLVLGKNNVKGSKSLGIRDCTWLVLTRDGEIIAVLGFLGCYPPEVFEGGGGGGCDWGSGSSDWGTNTVPPPPINSVCVSGLRSIFEKVTPILWSNIHK